MAQHRGLVGAPTEWEMFTFQVLYVALLVPIAVIGVAWIIHNWRKYGAAAAAGSAEREARLPSGGPDGVTPRAGT